MTQTSASDTGLIVSDAALRMQVTTMPGTKRSWNEYMDEWIQNEAGRIWSNKSNRERHGACVSKLEQRGSLYHRPRYTMPLAGV